MFMELLPLGSFLFFIFVLTARIIYLRRKGIRLSPGNRRKPLFMILLYPVFAALFILWMGEMVLLTFSFPGVLLPDWAIRELLDFPFLQFAGIILISVALILWVLTLFHFKWSLRFGLDHHNQGELITTGVFSRSRNPFFLSVNLYFAGLALFHPSLFFITMAVLTLVSIHFFILKEERFLHNYYGDAYREYAERVGRYF